MSRPLVVCFGDSLTQYGFKNNGWGQQLQTWYETKVDVLNRGMSGYNVKFALNLVDEIFKPLKPSLITIMFGSNDVSTGIQGLTLEEFESYYSEMVQKIKKIHPECEILLISPPPLVDSQDRKNETLEKYAEIVEKIGKKETTHFIDLWHGMQIQPKWEEFLEDGLHFNAEGNEYLYLEVSNFINNEIEKVNPEKLKFPFTYWKDLFIIEK
jgi:lysophospholipase L1-like esterase